MSYMEFSDLAAHLTTFGGTLVEKHWCSECTLYIHIYIHVYQERQTNL